MSRPHWGIVALIAAVCAFGGGVVGFVIGVAGSKFVEDIAGEFNPTEEDAEIGNPQSFDGIAYGFQYPSNWSIDEDLSYDLEHYISVDSPGGSYIVVEFEEYASDTEEVLQAEIAELGDYVAGAQYTFFGSYGSYEGSGVSITVRSSGFGETYRIFCYSEGEMTVTITEYVFEMDRKMVQPGFELIERTMVLK